MRVALSNEKLLGGVLDAPSWLIWRALLIATLGESLNDEERAAFKKLTGRDHEPGVPVKELWVIAGRRGGKSRAIAVLAIYLSLLVDWKDHLVSGETGRCVIVAQNKDQAGIVFSYISAIIEESQFLRGMVASEVSETIILTSGIRIEVHAGSFRGLRGMTIVCGICDEIAHWFQEGYSLNPDSEILIALRPSLKRVKGILACIGSPYARRGSMWET